MGRGVETRPGLFFYQLELLRRADRQSFGTPARLWGSLEMGEMALNVCLWILDAVFRICRRD